MLHFFKRFPLSRPAPRGLFERFGSLSLSLATSELVEALEVGGGRAHFPLAPNRVLAMHIRLGLAFAKQWLNTSPGRSKQGACNVHAIRVSFSQTAVEYISCPLVFLWWQSPRMSLCGEKLMGVGRAKPCKVLVNCGVKEPVMCMVRHVMCMVMLS